LSGFLVFAGLSTGNGFPFFPRSGSFFPTPFRTCTLFFFCHFPRVVFSDPVDYSPQTVSVGVFFRFQGPWAGDWLPCAPFFSRCLVLRPSRPVSLPPPPSFLVDPFPVPPDLRSFSSFFLSFPRRLLKFRLGRAFRVVTFRPLGQNTSRSSPPFLAPHFLRSSPHVASIFCALTKFVVFFFFFHTGQFQLFFRSRYRTPF